MSLPEPATLKSASELRAIAESMRATADLQMDATVASAYRTMASSYDTMAAHRELAEARDFDPRLGEESPPPAVDAKRSIPRQDGRDE